MDSLNEKSQSGKGETRSWVEKERMGTENKTKGTQWWGSERAQRTERGVHSCSPTWGGGRSRTSLGRTDRHSSLRISLRSGVRVCMEGVGLVWEWPPWRPALEKRVALMCLSQCSNLTPSYEKASYWRMSFSGDLWRVNSQVRSAVLMPCHSIWWRDCCERQS